jgi:hypothetical protein
MIARSYRLFAFVLAVLLGLAMMAPAYAGPPVFETVPVDVTWIDDNASGQCGFPVELHLAGTFNISRHDLQSGTLMEIIRMLDATVTFTNLETGATYTSKVAGPEILTIEADGTVSKAGSGIFSLVTVRGQGVLLKDIGRIVWDEAGNVVFEAGEHPVFVGGDVQGLCTVLS